MIALSPSLQSLIYGKVPLASTALLPVHLTAPVYPPYFKNHGYYNNLHDHTITITEQAKFTLEVAGSHNDIGKITVTGSKNASIYVYINGDFNVLTGFTITCSENAVLVIHI